MKRNRGLVSILLLGCSFRMQAQTFTEFALPTPGAFPSSIVAGPDRALWFIEIYGHAIGRCTLAGAITEFALQNPLRCPGSIAAGPDGNIWFTAGSYSCGIAEVVRITPAGVLTGFPLPDPKSFPGGIVTGPDGALWFTEPGRIGRITTSGAITEYDVAIPANSATPITVGPDGNLWFAETNGQTIGSITPLGVVEKHAVPGVVITSITAGPDGAVWFTDFWTSRVYRFSLTGQISHVSLSRFWPEAEVFDKGLGDIISGSDGNLWVVAEGRHTLYTPMIPGTIARVTPTGRLREFPIPIPDAEPVKIAIGSDGNIWFTEFKSNSIVRLTDVGLPTERSRQVRFR